MVYNWATQKIMFGCLLGPFRSKKNPMDFPWVHPGALPCCLLFIAWVHPWKAEWCRSWCSFDWRLGSRQKIRQLVIFGRQNTIKKQGLNWRSCWFWKRFCERFLPRPGQFNWWAGRLWLCPLVPAACSSLFSDSVSYPTAHRQLGRAEGHWLWSQKNLWNSTHLTTEGVVLMARLDDPSAAQGCQIAAICIGIPYILAEAAVNLSKCQLDLAFLVSGTDTKVASRLWQID